MPTSVQVHSLPEPPEGHEWHVGYPDKGTREAHRIISIVARRKWEPKPGDDVRLKDGRQVLIEAPSIGVSGLFITTFHGVLEFVHRSDIIGPWVDEAASPAEPEPSTDDVGEGYTRIVWDAANPPVRMEGDEWTEKDQPQWSKITPDDVGQKYTQFDFDVRPNRRRKLPAAEPAWTAPEWARVLGWMTQDGVPRPDDFVGFYNVEPQFASGGWYAIKPLGIRLHIWFMPVSVAKSINLYPPHWDSLPASERIINLGGE